MTLEFRLATAVVVMLLGVVAGLSVAHYRNESNPSCVGAKE